MSYFRSVLNEVNCFTCSHLHSDYSSIYRFPTSSRYHHFLSSPLLRSRFGEECSTESFLYINTNSFVDDSLSLSNEYSVQKQFFTNFLRMRNGNFIEYSLDLESKDETCSIISSHQHLATSLSNGNGDFQSSSRQQQTSANYYINSNNNNHSTAAISELNPNSTINQSDQFLSSKCSLYQHNFLGNNNSKIADYNKRQSSPISETNPIRSNFISSTTSLSPFLTKPLTTMATTTTSTTVSSSISSINVLTNQQQKNLFFTKISSSSNEMFNRNMDNNPMFANIYWPVKNCTEIEIHPEHTAFDVIQQMLTSQIYALSNPSLSTRDSVSDSSIPNHVTQWAYALRLVCRRLNPNDHIWIHPTKNMHEFLDQNQMQLEKGWKLELRIRYIPNIEELYRNDFLSFKFLYEQVLEELLFLELSPTKLISNQDLILELGCYEIFRTHPYLTPQSLEKNSNWEALENDFHRIFPISFINSMKSKHLRKLIKSKYKKIYLMNQERVAFNFLTLVPQLINFHREIFHCSLGESIWCVPVDLMIGPNIGIAYFTSNSSPPTVIVKSFDLVEQINIVSYSTMNKNLENGNDDSIGTTSKKILLNIRIKNEDDVLILTCFSFSMAQSIADLIDGYHRLATNSPDSIWLNIISDKSSIENHNNNECNSGKSSLKSNSSEIIVPKRADFNLIKNCKPSFESDPNSDNNQQNQDDNQDDADYSNPVEVCLEINREHLKIDKIVGNGQFGDVHKGIFKKHSKDGTIEEEIPVAIKISRVQNDNTMFGRNDIHITDQKLLCEAERMHKLDHHNIIRLIGVCSSSPVYVIMELAEYGELRSFLLKNGSQLEQRRLIEYSYQIANALAYLEFKQFVHRDIAARNVLVFSFDCVKLADFGLSRYIEDTSYYMATNSKLPIKWMAPESINFRRFTTSSDVWMFGVCIWEIFMLGKKPFPGVKNSDVIGLIECGDRLLKPSRCPDQLYELLLKCWRYEPDRRPTFRMVKKKIYDVYQNELGLIGAIARIDNVNGLSSSKSSLSSLSVSKEQSSSTSSSLSRMHLSNTKFNQSYRFMTDNNKNNLSQSESNLSFNASQSSALGSAKIKEILDEQRKQMEEDQRWLQQNEFKWQSNPIDSDRDVGSEHNSTTLSIYEDAHCDKNVDIPPQTQLQFNAQFLYSVPILQSKSRIGDESYNSYKSTKSSFDHNSNPSTSSSIDSANNNEDCGLSVSLKKFFKHNQLTNAKVRQEMMEKINCASADVDRKEDPVYWSIINVVNSVRYLLKGVQELNTTEYVDLVKNVGLEVRNLLANVDIFLETIPKDDHNRNIIVAQKKLSADMNDLVDSMKKTIMYSDTPMEGVYKQNMLEVSYILVINSKNLMDTIDEIRLKLKSHNKM